MNAITVIKPSGYVTLGFAGSSRLMVNQCGISRSRLAEVTLSLIVVLGHAISLDSSWLAEVSAICVV
jgi:hypothetical protein